MILPTREYQGRTCVVVSVSATWLMHLLAGIRHSKSFAGAIRNMVLDCVDEYKKASSQGNISAAAMPEAIVAAPGPPPKKGRHKILDSDDEQELTPSTAVVQAKAKRKRSKRCKVRRGQFCKAVVRGISMQFSVMAGPKVLVVVEDNCVQRIVDDLLGRKDEPMRASSQDDIKSALEEEDRGRIIFTSGSMVSAGS